MTYIVVYQREDGSSGVEECADIDLAVVTAERLRNVDSVERPRIYKTEEITYDFKPYYRVEVTSAAAAAPSSDEWSPSADASTSGTAADASAPAAPAAPAAAQPAAPASPPPAPSTEADPVIEAEPAAPTVLAEPVVNAPAANIPQSVAQPSSSEPGSSDDEVRSPGGLFATAKAKAESAADDAAGAVSGDTEPDDDSVPPRRGLFGR